MSFRPLLAAVLAACAAVAPLPGAPHDVVLVAHVGSKVRINEDVVRAVFTLRLREWPDGTVVRVYVLPDGSPLHTTFCRDWLEAHPYVLRGLWDRQVFTGSALAPNLVRTEQEMLERLLATPGAVGYAGVAAARPHRRKLRVVVPGSSP